MLNSHRTRGGVILGGVVPRMRFDGPATVEQPLLQLRSPANAGKPWFDLDVPLDLTIGDKIEYQFATAADFASPTSVVTTLTSQQASYAHLDLAQAELATATTYYFRMRYEYVAKTGREPKVGPWSETKTFTYVAPSIPSFANMALCGTVKYASTTFDGAIVQDREIDLGPEDAGRNIFVGVGGTMNTTFVGARIVTDKNIAAGDYAGTDLTAEILNTIATNQQAGLYRGVVAAGRPARVYGLLGSGQFIGLVVGRAYNPASTTPSATDKTDRAAPADPFNIGASQTIAAGGIGVAVVSCLGGFSSRAWQNSYTEVGFVNTTSTQFLSMAVRTATGAAQAAINRTNFQFSAGVVGIWV